MPVEGIPKSNAVALMELEGIPFFNGKPEMVAHGAYVHTTSGVTYGRFTCSKWSKQTLDKLEELRASIEIDLAMLVLDGVGSSTSACPRLTDEPGGIGEHAGLPEVAPAWP